MLAVFRRIATFGLAGHSDHVTLPISVSSVCHWFQQESNVHGCIDSPLECAKMAPQSLTWFSRCSEYDTDKEASNCIINMDGLTLDYLNRIVNKVDLV